MVDMQNKNGHALYSILHPKHIAVIGASNNAMNMGARLLSNILALGFDGQIFPVHPHDRRVLGLKAYPHVSGLPIVPDLAIIVVSNRIVPQILRDCGDKGIQRAIIISGGFREAGEEGMVDEQRLREIAAQHGIRFVGPNCIGVVNPAHRFNTTIFHYDAAMQGFIGMASQSGSFITQMFAHLKKFGLGFSQGISVGNQADIDLADCVEYLADCDRTRVIGLYIEGISNPRKFMCVARETSKRKPIVAMYVGGSKAGSRAGWSHSGAMAGPDAIYNGVFRQCGIVRAYTIEELFDYCWALGTQPLMSGNRVVVFTHSGGPGAAAADAAERAGLVLPDLSDAMRAELSDKLPHTGSLNNPVDTTFARNFDELMVEVPKLLLKSEEFDGILMYFLFAKDTMTHLLERVNLPFFASLEEFEAYMLGLCGRLAEVVASSNKPLLGSSFVTRSERFIRVLEDLGIPILPSPERSARAMGALYRYSKMRAALMRCEEG